MNDKSKEKDNDKKESEDDDDDEDEDDDDDEFTEKTRKLLENAIENQVNLIWTIKTVPKDIIRQFNTGGDEDYFLFIPKGVEDYLSQRLISRDGDDPEVFKIKYGELLVYSHS